MQEMFEQNFSRFVQRFVPKDSSLNNCELYEACLD